MSNDALWPWIVGIVMGQLFVISMTLFHIAALLDVLVKR